MGRYSKVYRRMWNDEKFRSLSPLKPSGQALWLYLLTCTENQNIPGLFEAREVAMADKLRWDLDAFRYAFQEALNQGMIKADWEAGLVWLPKGIHHNRPGSINVVKSWGNTWDDLPECGLKSEAYQYLLAFFDGMGDAFRYAFEESCAKACAIQEQEQEHRQEQNISESNDSIFLPKKNNKQKTKNTKAEVERLKQKKKEANKKIRSRPAKTKPAIDLGSDLFALPDSDRECVLEMLRGKEKGDVDKKPVLERLEKLVLQAYSTVKEKHTGSGYAPPGKHGKVAAQKIGVGCLSYRLKPEQMIEYWVENNFTTMKFPTLLFISSDKNMETAAYGLEPGSNIHNIKSKGYIPLDENYNFDDDDSEDDSEELLLLAEELRQKKLEEENRLAVKKAEEAKRVDEWFAAQDKLEGVISDEGTKNDSGKIPTKLPLHAERANRGDAKRKGKGTAKGPVKNIGGSVGVARGRRKDVG